MKLSENPFCILGVSIRDSKQVIDEKADDRCFDEPEREEIFEKAKGILLNPQQRLQAELGWFPDVQPQEEQRLLAAATKQQTIYMSGMNKLAAMNQKLIGMKQKVQLANDIVYLDNAYREMDMAQLLAWVNKSRSVSGFPAVQGVEPIEAVWHEVRNNIREQLQEAVDNMAASQYTEIALEVSQAVLRQQGKYGGIVQDFMDGYRLSVEQQLEEWEEHTLQLFDKVLDNPSSSNVQAACGAMDKGGRLARPLTVMSVAEDKNNFCYVGPVYNKLYDVGLNLCKEKGEYGAAITLFEKLLLIANDIPSAVKNIEEILKFIREVKEEEEAASAKAKQAQQQRRPAAQTTARYNAPSVPAKKAADRPARPAYHSTMMSPETPSSSSAGSSGDSGCGGCLLLFLLPAIGGAIAGPFGFVIGIVLAFMCADD